MNIKLKKYPDYKNVRIFVSILFIPLILIAGCTASNRDEKTDYTTESNEIIETAREEQNNEMYSTSSDSVYLYWLNSSLSGLRNLTKCNIFALNTIFKAGFQCPKVYTLTHDLFDKENFNDIFPVIEINNTDEIMNGDLIIWDGHIIIFEKISIIGNNIYAVGIWGGSRKSNNGSNIINNVAYGKYKLEGNYIIRRPQKR